MIRRGKRFSTGLQPTFTKRSTSATNEFWLTGPIDSAAYKKIRWTLDVVGLGAIEARRIYRYGDDGVTWGSTITAGSFQTSPLVLTTDLESGQTPHILVQLGVEVRNTSGSRLESGLFGLDVEP